MDYVNAIKSEIKETIEQNQNLHALLLWDFLKCHIRGKSISFSSLKSKQRRKQENNLIVEISSLGKRLVQSPTMETKKMLDEKMKNLETLIETKTAGVMLRSKARWVEHGEKHTKYFLNLEKRDYNKKVISKLKKSDGTEITDPNHILREEENFYTNLYSPKISNFSKEELEEANIFSITTDQCVFESKRSATLRGRNF